MKKFIFLIVALFLVAASFSQNADKKWALGLGPGIFDNMEKSEIALLSEVYLSRYLSPSFDLIWNNNGGFSDDGWDIVNTSLNLRYKLYNGMILQEDSKIQPYLFGGVGMLWDNQENGANFVGGIGSKFPLSSSVALFIEGGYISGIDAMRWSPEGQKVSVTDNHLKAIGGIEIAFGAAKDSDGDGVSDKKDDCPDTPPGVQVDEKGCPLDSDGDGVPDYKDDCPNEAGEARFNGCPDKDGDGIPDKDDDCPDVAGLAKFKGCPDTDGDGVPDKDDKCPNTPKGCPVDAEGCPLDSDGDGVIDCEDKCPSVPGPADNDGCPSWETLQIPSIYFDFDKSTIRSEGMKKLDELVAKLNGSKEYEIEVGGHADSIGTEKYNMGLSQRRAEAVVKHLLSKGISNAYVSSNYYGEGKPAVPNTSSDNRQLNRRVEFEKVRVKK